jgi:uncharacterized protein YlaI
MDTFSHKILHVFQHCFQKAAAPFSPFNYSKSRTNRVERVYWCVRCWRRIEIDWTDRVESGEVLHRTDEEGNMQRTAKPRNTKWIVHVLRRN